MYGPDPHSIMQYAKMLAAEQERAERRRATQPKRKPLASLVAPMATGLIESVRSGLRVLLHRRAVAYRG